LEAASVALEVWLDRLDVRGVIFWVLMGDRLLVRDLRDLRDLVLGPSDSSAMSSMD
jgi:hypothetical protein